MFCFNFSSMHFIAFLSCFVSVLSQQKGNIYWGSYDLTIPGGSGSGNAVDHLKLPDNAPQFFNFGALHYQQQQKPSTQRNPIPQPAPKSNNNNQVSYNVV